jgi:nicotinate-nucleotide adenylyltransferase
VTIALYGGSFNPPHVAHQLACTYVLACAPVDELWMVPTFKHPFDKQLAPFGDRVAMCELAARLFNGRVKVSRIEEELGGESYTLNMVRALKARHPSADFALVIGADLVAERERWHGWPELKTAIRFIVVGRQGYGEADLSMPLPAVSSTDVRERLARGADCTSLIDREVIEYIQKKGLYR